MMDRSLIQKTPCGLPEGAWEQISAPLDAIPRDGGMISEDELIGICDHLGIPKRSRARRSK